MTRLRIAVVALLAAGWLSAQPPAPPPVPPALRPFGVSPEQFRNSAVARWADQTALELGKLKAEAAAPAVQPPTRAAVAAAADRAARQAVNLAKAARRVPADRARMEAARAALELDVAEVTAVVRRDPFAAAATRQSLSHVRYAVQQLDAAFAEGATDPAQVRAAVTRLADSLEDQADALRDAAGRPGVGPGLAPAARGLATAAKQFGRSLRDGDLDRARHDYRTTLTAAWAGVAGAVGQGAVPPDVRAQAARTEGAYRRLGKVLLAGAAPPRPTGNPAGEPPPFDPKDGGWKYVPPDPKLGGPGGWVYAPGQGRPAVGVNPAAGGSFAVGAGVGGGPRVRVFGRLNDPPAADFFAYDPETRSGVRVAMADLTGDGIADVVTAPGPGLPPLVRVFDGRDLDLVAEFPGADAGWLGGLHVAAHDLTRDGRALVAVAPDVGGGPAVKVFDLAAGREVASFFAFPENLRGGARLAWGDTDGDRVPELLVAPGPCDHAPVVRVFGARDWKARTDYLAADPRWRGGLWVAAGGTGPGGRCVVAAGHDAGGPPAVRIIDPANGRPVRDWLAFPDDYRGGVRVAVGDFDRDGVADVACAAGPGLRGCPVRVFSGKTGRPAADFPAIPDFDGGVFVDAR